MKKYARRLAWVGVALCAVALGFGATLRLLGPEPPGVTEANLTRISAGMTLLEVRGILGDYDRSVQMEAADPEMFGVGRKPRFRCEWTGESGMAFVFFDGCGRVESLSWAGYEEQGNPIAWLRSLLGR